MLIQNNNPIFQRYLQLQSNDSVVVALIDLPESETIAIGGTSFNTKAEIKAGHKCAVKDIAKGELIYKYGAPIGVATDNISIGEHVHSHNMETTLKGIEEYEFAAQQTSNNSVDISNEKTFMGYKRHDGKVGTRNEIWVLSTVGCVSKLAQNIALKGNSLYEEKCDGIFAFTHPFGCSQTGDDHNNTKKLTAALAQHPNAGGVLIVGLGCENNQGQALLEDIPTSYHHRIRFFNCQDSDDEVTEGLNKLKELISVVEKTQRQPCPLSTLVLGVKCGASDGFSGLSANPLVGSIADRVCNANGTVLLTEVPEMFGAERILMNRAINREVFNNMVSLVDNFKQYFIDNKQNIYENPSPGNKAGGITTLEEKSMGAIQKGGTSTIYDVLDYAEIVKHNRLNLLEAPGNDAVSSTALTASGASLVLFTTGRGTPLGFPVPTIKIASNSTLAQSKRRWIDFDAGKLFSGTRFSDLSDELLDYIVSVASGEQVTRNESNDQREIAVWKNGVTL